MSAQKKAGTERYICKICAASFPNNQGLQKHLSNKKAHSAATGGASGVVASSSGSAAAATKVCAPCVAAAVAAKSKPAKK